MSHCHINVLFYPLAISKPVVVVVVTEQLYLKRHFIILFITMPDVFFCIAFVLLMSDGSDGNSLDILKVGYTLEGL